MATSGKRSAGGSSYTLVGSLPSGPDEARAQSLPRGAAKEDDVRRLASALGVTGEPKRVERAWQVGGLRVEDVAGNPWSMSMYACGPDQPVSSDGSVASCTGVGIAVDGGSGTVGSDPASGSVSSGSGSAPAGTTTPPTAMAPPPAPKPAPAITPCPANARCAAPEWTPPVPPSPGPTADVDAARRAAAVVLAKLGLDDADVDVEGAGEHAFVRADPRVDGLKTSGYSTSLEIDAEQKVVGGGGYLGRPAEGASYPLISAKQAFDDLPEQPRALMLCPETEGGEPACPQPAPAQVTGAELGLMLTALADEDAALLPAWLFTVKDWPAPLPQVAIEPRFLQLPTPEPVDPGLVDPVPPAEPPTQVDPAGPRSSFSFDAAFPADEPNLLTVQYGDSGSCPHMNVTPLVKESADSIVVTLEGDAQSTKQACTDDYRQQLVPLKLERPLGDRTVIDGSTGKQVAVDRTCARPMGAPAAPKNCVK